MQSCRAAGQRLGLWLAPAGSLRERCLRKVSQKVHHARCRVVSQPGLDLAEVLRQNEDRKGIVIYPPFIDWSWMRQRPHQLMAQFASAGYLSLFCSPKARCDLFRGFRASRRAALPVRLAGFALRSAQSDPVDQLDRPLGNDQAVPFAGGDLRLPR